MKSRPTRRPPRRPNWQPNPPRRRISKPPAEPATTVAPAPAVEPPPPVAADERARAAVVRRLGAEASASPAINCRRRDAASTFRRKRLLPFPRPRHPRRRLRSRSLETPLPAVERTSRHTDLATVAASARYASRGRNLRPSLPPTAPSRRNPPRLGRTRPGATQRREAGPRPQKPIVSGTPPGSRSTPARRARATPRWWSRRSRRTAFTRRPRASAANQGAVGVSFTIGPGGRVAAASVVRPSGFTELDDAARQIVRSIAPPPPARRFFHRQHDDPVSRRVGVGRLRGLAVSFADCVRRSLVVMHDERDR